MTKSVYITNTILIILLCINFYLLTKNKKEKNINFYGKQKRIIQYESYKKHYKWLTKIIYDYVKYEGQKNNIHMSLIFAIIDAESQGKNIVSKKNRNGTRDYGLMQINSVHEKYTRKLLNKKYNIKKGVSYLKYCIYMSNKRYGHTNIKTIIRLYNQGIHGKKRYYQNWKYVEKIYKHWKKI